MYYVDNNTQYGDHRLAPLAFLHQIFQGADIILSHNITIHEFAISYEYHKWTWLQLQKCS